SSHYFATWKPAQAATADDSQPVDPLFIQHLEQVRAALVVQRQSETRQPQRTQRIPIPIHRELPLKGTGPSPNTAKGEHRSNDRAETRRERESCPSLGSWRVSPNPITNLPTLFFHPNRPRNGRLSCHNGEAFHPLVVPLLHLILHLFPQL